MLNVKFYFNLLYIIATIDSHVIRKSQSYQKTTQHGSLSAFFLLLSFITDIRTSILIQFLELFLQKTLWFVRRKSRTNT